MTTSPSTGGPSAAGCRRSKRVACPALAAALVLAGATASVAPADDDDVLRGPKVQDQAVLTLVRTDFNGNFYPVEGRPEQAALVLLPLDAGHREAAMAVIEERMRELEIFLVDHVDNVREATDALAREDRERAREIAEDMHAAFDPERPRSPLLEPLRTALGTEEHAALARLVDDYWSAWIDWELRGTPDPTDADRARTESRLAFSLFQAELGAAYNSSIRPYRDRLETIYRVAEPTPEQRAAIRAMVIEHIRSTRLSATPEQRAALAQGLYDILDEQQRIKLFELLVAGL